MSHPQPRRGASLAAGAVLLLCTLALSLSDPAYAQEKADICIKDINGRVVMLEGECPGFGAHPGALPDAGASTKRRTATMAPAGGSSSSGATTDATSKGATSTPGAQKAGTDAAKAGNGATKGGSTRDSRVASMERRLDQIRDTKDDGEASAAFESLVMEGGAVVSPIAQVYRDKNADPRTRWIAGRALGRIPGTASSDALIAGLKDPMPLARVAAARGLADLGERRALPALTEALKDPGAVVRAAVVDTIGTLGTSRDAKSVAGELTAKHNFVKSYGLFVRAHAATALGKLGGEDAIQALISVVDDKDRDTREAARASLTALTGRSGPPPGAGSEKDRWLAWYQARARSGQD